MATGEASGITALVGVYDADGTAEVVLGAGELEAMDGDPEALAAALKRAL